MSLAMSSIESRNSLTTFSPLVVLLAFAIELYGSPHDDVQLVANKKVLVVFPKQCLLGIIFQTFSDIYLFILTSTSLSSQTWMLPGLKATFQHHPVTLSSIVCLSIS